MLLSKDCGWYQDRHLFAVPDHLERGTQRNLGLSVAHITTDQPVHGHLRFHVGHDVSDGPALIRCFSILECSLKLLKGSVRRRKGMSFLHPARRIELEKLPGHLSDRFFHPLFYPLPRLAAHLVQTRGDAVHAYILLHAVHAVHGHVELVIILIFYDKEIVGNVGHLELHKALILANAVLCVHHKIVGF